MLYKDRANYGGIRLHVEGEDEAGVADMDVASEDNNVAETTDNAQGIDSDKVHESARPGQFESVETTVQDKVEINFNVANYLPKELQLYFNRVVAEFILVPVKAARALQTEQQGPPQSTQATNAAVSASLGEALKTTITRRLCRMVDAIDKK